MQITTWQLKIAMQSLTRGSFPYLGEWEVAGGPRLSHGHCM